MDYSRNRSSWETDPYLRSLHQSDHVPAPLGPVEPRLDLQPPSSAPKFSPSSPTSANAHTTPRSLASAGNQTATSRAEVAASNASAIFSKANLEPATHSQKPAASNGSPDAPISPEASFLE